MSVSNQKVNTSDDPASVTGDVKTKQMPTEYSIKAQNYWNAIVAFFGKHLVPFYENPQKWSVAKGAALFLLGIFVINKLQRVVEAIQ